MAERIISITKSGIYKFTLIYYLLIEFSKQMFIENSLATGRKKTALKVLTNTVQSSKKSDGKDLKVPKVLPMPEFETEINCKSTSHDKFHKETEEFDHFGCLALKEKGNFIN